MHNDTEGRTVPAIHGKQMVDPGPVYVQVLAADLGQEYDRDGLIELYGRFCQGAGVLDHILRCEIENHVWIGPQSYFDARA